MTDTVLKKPFKRTLPTGKPVASVPGFVLMSVGRKATFPTSKGDQATHVVAKVANALAKPGIRKAAVFKGKRADVFSYSVDTTDVTRVVRTSADGKRKVGRLVGHKFVPMKVA